MNDISLLQNREYIEALEETLINCQTEVLIVSAYLRSEILDWAREKIPKETLVNIVTRWTPQDLVFGASDLHAFEIARSEKWGFYIDQDLHAKSILVDSSTLFLGSANFTSRGTHLFGSGNNELCIKVRASPDEADRIEQYVTNSYRISIPMYMEMKSYIESLDNIEEGKNPGWPDEIESCITPWVGGIWVDECFYSSPEEFFSGGSNENIEHDRKLLGSQERDPELIKQSRIIKWLDSVVKESNQARLTFGYITKKLHDAIITDPKPYRKEVKMLVKNMFDWIELYGVYDIERFSHTVSIKCLFN